MFVFSVKANKKTMLWSAVAGIAVVAVGLLAWLLLSMTSIRATVTYTAATEEERVAVLTNLGLETDGVAQVYEIRLPDEADPVFAQYNALQQQANMDLTPYLGKRVKVYCYPVLNHPDGEAMANLYVYNGKIIGGDITPLDTAASAKPLV